MKLFVPGRICLFGEHSDWAGGYRRVNPELEKGYTLICGTEQGIYARVEPHPNELILTAATPEGEQCGPYTIPLEPQRLLEEAQSGSFWSYIAGVAYQAQIRYHVGGLILDNYRTDLPIQKGLSSSAAICVLAARALNRLYDLKLTTRGEMELAYQGEVTTPSRCGRMDQGCAFGNRPVLMTFDGNRLETAELHIGQDMHFVIVDLHAHKDTMKILSRLNDCFPVAENRTEKGVQELLGPINRRIVQQAIQALEDGDARRIGELMVEAQARFDRFATPACPEELTAPVLHRVLAHEPLQALVWGGKGVGSQGDGAAQFIARSKADQQAVVDIVERDLGLYCLTLTLRADGLQQRTAGRPLVAAQGRAPGARPQVRKAVIPAAGLGTRLFPATRAIKKELFPIVGADGIAKPAILLLIEEALDAGLDEIIIIIQQKDLEDFRALLTVPISQENYDKLPPHLQAYARRILDMGRHVTFVVQPRQEGFGHAVHRAREAVGDEPFLLMLGDHLYRSNNSNSCIRQMVEAYDRYGISLLGLRRTPEREIGSYGTVTGTWHNDNKMLDISRIAEKPTEEFARRHLSVPNLPQGEYLTLFGLYIINPQIFEYLEELITSGRREGGEFQLTTALERLRESDRFLGLIVEGQSYDIGLPDTYLQALIQLRREQDHHA